MEIIDGFQGFVEFSCGLEEILGRKLNQKIT